MALMQYLETTDVISLFKIISLKAPQVGYFLLGSTPIFVCFMVVGKGLFWWTLCFEGSSNTFLHLYALMTGDDLHSFF